MVEHEKQSSAGRGASPVPALHVPATSGGRGGPYRAGGRRAARGYHPPMTSAVPLKTVTVGLLGCGTVGQNVLHLLQRRQDIFSDIGVRIEVAGVLVRDADRARDVPAGTPDGSSDNALLNVTLAWSGNAGVTDAAGTADRSTVVPGTVLSKKVSNLTRAPATEADTVDAYPGDTLRYCLTATNTGPFTASAVVVQDTLKPSVTYAPGTLTLDGTTLTDAADTDAGELVARQVTVRVPTLAAGAQTRICFQVLVP